MCLSLLFLASVSANHVQYEGSKYLPPVYLVRTTTVKVWREKNEYFDRGRLHITKIIAGPERLLDREFEATTESPYQLGSSIARPRYPNTEVWLLKEGAEGLWWVYEEGNNQKICPVLDGTAVHTLGLRSFPYQKTKSKPFFSFGEPDRPIIQDKLWKEGEAFATVVGEVYSARTDDDRLALLERYASTPESPIAIWAIALVSRGPRDPSIKLLRGLSSNGKLDIFAQMMVDELLCLFDTKKWSGCPERKAMLSRWFDSQAKPELFSQACFRLHSIRNGNVDFDMSLFVDIVSQAVANSDRMTKGKQIDLGNLLRFSKYWFDDSEKDKAMEFLKKMKNLSKSEDLSEAIDNALKSLSKK